eukprot:GFYU01030341.1.p1 GENE.GFYU01030341.1~~GFYU01030341.1.p1  ORF type:complete len:156 (+),score=15.30 GFYU01030341.1:19-486(+)
MGVLTEPSLYLKHCEDTLQRPDTSGSRLIESMCLISRQGLVVEGNGDLLTEFVEHPEKTQQFLPLFSVACDVTNSEGKSEESSLPMHYMNGFNILGKHFVVHAKDEMTVSAVSRGRAKGLVVSHMPFGTLLSLYSKPNRAPAVIAQLDNVLSCLR